MHILSKFMLEKYFVMNLSIHNKKFFWAFFG